MPGMGERYEPRQQALPSESRFEERQPTFGRPVGRRANFRQSSLRAAEERFGWLLISPSLLVFILVGTLPILGLIAMSMARINLTSSRPVAFIGLGNFIEMAQDDRFWHALRIMLVYASTSVVLQIIIGLALALVLFRSLVGEGILRVAILLPMILAPVVVGLVWRTLMLTPDYGLVDFVAQQIGFGSKPWLTDARWALVSVVAIHTWQWTPYAFLVFLASLHALPVEPFEAAMIDGANSWQRFWYLTLPLLKPAIIIVAALRTVIALRAFDAIWSATAGGPGTATEILNLYAYRVSFTSLQLGYGAALSVTLLAFTTVISWLFFRRMSENW